MGDITLRQEDVLHIPGLGFDGLIGYSPIAMARNAVGMTMACEEYGASFFANGANPGGVLEHPGVLKDPAKVRDSWNAVYRGTTNAHKIAVLEEGMKSIQRVVDTRSLVTRLYAYGADGMTFASINNGKEYVENTEYSTEIRVSTLDCSSFTNPYQMLEYTEMRLAELALNL